MVDSGRVMLFSLIIMRMSGCVLFNTIFGRRNIPSIVKAGFIMVLSVLLYTSTDGTVPEPVTITEYAVLLLKELMVGYVLGFVVALFLYVILFAGEFIDLQMGISMSKIYDAQSNASISISATFYNALFILLFFAADGHLALLQIFLSSADIVPYGAVVIEPGISNAIVDIFIQCTVFGLSFAFPIFAAEFLAEVGVGVLMKTIPQINVFVVNLQTKLFIGMMMILIMFGPMGEYLQNLVYAMLDSVRQVITLMM